MLHIAAATLWLGNFAVTGVWSIRAALTRERALFAFAAREILFTDLIFTFVFGSAVVISGFALADAESIPVFQTFWTRTAFWVVVGCGTAWAAVLLPLEMTMYRRSRNGTDAHRVFMLWNLVGWSITMVLFGVIYLMIAKPV